MAKLPADPNAPLIDCAGVCRLFNVSSSTLWRWVKAGKIPAPLKLAGATKNYWRREELNAAIEAAAAAREVAA